MVAHHVVVYFARRAQLCVSHPVNNVLTKLTVHAVAAVCVAQVTDKVLKVQAGGGELVVAVALAVLTDDGRGDVMLVPRLEAWVLHKLVFERRDQTLKGVSHDEKLEVST